MLSSNDFLISRSVLLANHVLSGEPVAMQKLQPHAGRCIELRFDMPQGLAQSPLSRLLPKPEPLRLSISRAGLLEWTPSAEVALTVTLGVPSLAQAWDMLRHRTRPPMQIEGDAHLAEAVSWVAQNVRWDVAHDVSQWFGTPVAAGVSMVRSRVEQSVARWRQGRSA
jgi:ubiquinone biosynthesis accessory factor UbiJ